MMRVRHNLFVVAAVVLVVVLGGTALAQSSNFSVGTWKLNVAKSKFSPGTERKSGTTKIETAGAGFKTIVDTVGVDNTASHWEFSGNYDGKDYPVIGNNPYGDIVALARINATTVRLAHKKAGKITVTETVVLSSDGKTRTLTLKGTNVLGQTVDSVAVYEKQ